MTGRLQHWFAYAWTACLLTALPGAEAWAAVGSCQSRSDGKFECMEFVGALPAGLKAVCTISPGPKWVDSACPQNDVLGFCEVPRNDGIRQRLYCYRMAAMTDAQTLDFCRMGCRGAFSTAPGAASKQGRSPLSTDSPAAPSERTVRPPASAGAAVAGISRAPASPGASQYVMEENTNRFGEDYTDLDLAAPDPALCAQACRDDAKCRAWTYVKPGVQADGARCWLKDKVPPPAPDENCISGVNGQRR